MNMINGVDYRMIDDDGLHLMIEDKPVSLDVNTVIICAGQEPLRELFDELDDGNTSVEVIGGAFRALSSMQKRRLIRRAGRGEALI